MADLEGFVGRLDAAETRELFQIVAGAMPNQDLLAALNDILSDGDKDELMARWEPAQEEK